MIRQRILSFFNCAKPRSVALSELDSGLSKLKSAVAVTNNTGVSPEILQVLYDDCLKVFDEPDRPASNSPTTFGEVTHEALWALAVNYKETLGTALEKLLEPTSDVKFNDWLTKKDELKHHINSLIRQNFLHHRAPLLRLPALVTGTPALRRNISGVTLLLRRPQLSIATPTKDLGEKLFFGVRACSSKKYCTFDIQDSKFIVTLQPGDTMLQRLWVDGVGWVVEPKAFPYIAAEFSRQLDYQRRQLITVIDTALERFNS